MKKRLPLYIITLLLTLILSVSVFAACKPQENADGAENTEPMDSMSPDRLSEDEKQAMRMTSPLLGEWTAYAQAGEGAEVKTTLTFNEDGSVTSVHTDGTDAYAIYKSVTWTYDAELMRVTLDYVDFRNAPSSYTFQVNVARDNYIILIMVDAPNETTQKISLIRE